jgi:hypothetical protein
MVQKNIFEVALNSSQLMTSILFLCRLIFGMARLVAVTIKKNGKIVKRRLFDPYFGITFTSLHLMFLAARSWLLVSG